MIDFRPPVLGDRTWAAPLAAAEGDPLCDYSFPVLFCWQETYGVSPARLGSRMLVQMKADWGLSYLWPVGKGDPIPALDALAEDARRQGEPLRLICLGQAQKDWLTRRYPGRFTFSEIRAGFDYLYDVDRLADLPGRKLHAKRNHIHRLDESRPGWTWAALTEDDLPSCRAMNEAWYQKSLGRDGPEALSSLEEDHRAILRAMDYREPLGLEGVVLRWQGEVFAFALGSLLTDRVFVVHFERANHDLQGAYPAVNRAFAQYVRDRYPQVAYLNREDDMGVEGLRKAKLSYRPDHLQVNFCAAETASV